MDIKIKKLPKSEIEITAEIPADVFESYRTKATEELRKNFELPGFRKGMVPENMFLSKVPEMLINEEMAEMAINEAYPKIISENKLDPIGRPNVSITKIAKNNPLCFTLKTAVVPEIKLPDYKKISAKISEEKEELLVTDEEVEKVVEEIRRARAPRVETKEGETPIEPVLPEVTDEFVKTLGDFKDVAEFRRKIKENMKLEKERENKDKKRMKLIDALSEKTEIDLPQIIIDEEEDNLLRQLKYDVERMGLKWDEYLRNIKKTEAEIKKEWSKEAEKRAKVEFILSKISIEEKISPDEKELDAEVKHLLEHNKDADPNRARLYLAQIMTNQKVLEWLEVQK